MTKRLDATATTTSSSTVPSNDQLSNQLTEIFKEKQALQLRTQQLDRMVEGFPYESMSQSVFDLGGRNSSTN